MLHKVHIQINKPLKQVLQKHLVQRTVFKTYSFAPLFGIKFKKKYLFYFSMEAYIVHLAKGIRILGQGYALTFFLLLHSLENIPDKFHKDVYRM